MTRDAPQFRLSPVHYFGAACVWRPALFLLSTVLLTGCSTIATYKSNMASGPAKPVDYPILVYTEDMTVPRPCEVIGTVSIHDTRLTMFGGSVESEMAKVMQTAREKGADAVQMKSIEKPDFSNTNYRLVADLLRYTDTWETVAISEQAFANFLKTNQRTLDPIEGVWNGYGLIPHRIGIMREASKPGRDFIAFILNTENPTWHKGYKKIDIRHGPRPGTYLLDYYLDNFSKRETTVVLDKDMAFTLAIPTPDDEANIIIYSKNQ